jgi:hypothetical protein
VATPNYQGQSQSPASSGGWFRSWFGSTPTYIGAGQPATKSSTFGGTTPAYKTAPTDATACGVQPFAIVIPRDAIDPQQ